MIVTLTGENSFELYRALDLLIDNFIKTYSDIGLEKIDGEETSLERIGEAISTFPFLASKKMLILKNPSANKQFTDNADKLFRSLPDTTELILIETHLDKRSSYYKFLKSSTDFKTYPDRDRYNLGRWLVEETKNRHAGMGLDDAGYLIERVGANQHQLINEIEKLILYDQKVSKKSIDLLTEPTPRSKIFDLLDAAFNGDLRRVIRLYDEQRIMKVEPQQIIAMLSWQLQVLALIKAAGKGSPNEIASKTGLNPFTIEKSNKIVNRLTIDVLKQLVKDLLDIDNRLKSENLDPDESLKNYLVNITEVVVPRTI